MNLLVALASALLLQPVLDADTDLRLVASGTGDHDVDWYVDGARIATTAPGNATTVPFAAGDHEIWATTEHEGQWRALVRPEPRAGGSTVTYVDGWSAVHVPSEHAWPPAWPIALALAGVGIALVGRRRPKRP